MEVATKRKGLERVLGLTGDIEVDIERFGKNGRKISQSHRRSQTITSIERVVLDILLPACDNVSDGLLVTALYTRDSTRVFSYWTLGLLYLPTLFLVVHYLFKLTKRRRWYLELSFVIGFGPAIDWLISLIKLVRGEKDNQEDRELDKFIYIAKIVNGVIEASLQLIWTILLVSIGVNPIPWTDMTHIPDLLGNTIPFPASTVSLVFSSISIIKNMAYFWTNYGIVRPPGGLPEGARASFLVAPILITSLVFRLGCLVMCAVYLNIYTMAVLGLSLVTYNIIRLFRPCFDESSVLGEAVSGFANSLLPTPSSTDQRSHNLYLLHDLVTSSMMMCFLVIIQILNLDYNQPVYTRPSTLIIGHIHFLVFISVIIITMAINCLFRVVFYLVNKNYTRNKETENKSNWKKMKIKLTKIFIIKMTAVFVLGLLMIVSLALVAVSSIVTTKKVVPDGYLHESTEILGSNCQVKFEPGIEFLSITSITCQSVEDTTLIYFPAKNLLNNTGCFSNIRNEAVVGMTDSSDEVNIVDMGRSYPHSILQYSTNNKNSTQSQPPALTIGFGKWPNIVFISLMIFITLLGAGVFTLYKKHIKAAKPPLQKISLHSTKRSKIETNRKNKCQTRSPSRTV